MDFTYFSTTELDLLSACLKQIYKIRADRNERTCYRGCTGIRLVNLKSCGFHGRPSTAQQRLIAHALTYRGYQVTLWHNIDDYFLDVSWGESDCVSLSYTHQQYITFEAMAELESFE